jgi:hypothetical protein
MALDARFLQLNNNNAVSTFTSRTGNNSPTQANASFQATFKTGIQGGQPSVRFVGGTATQDYYELSSFSLAQPFFATITYKATTATPSPHLFDATANSNRVTFATDPTGVYPGELFIYSGGANFLTENFDSRGTWCITSGLYNGASSGLYRAGSQLASGSMGSNNFSTMRLGQTWQTTAPQTTAFDGDMASVTIYKNGTNQSIRKRLEHAAAYSFKLTCS